MNRPKSPNHFLNSISRSLAYSLRYILNGFGIGESYLFDEKGTTRTGIHVTCFLHRFRLRESKPLFEYLSLPEDAKAELKVLWQRELKRKQCDLYVSDFNLFLEGVRICWSCFPKATYRVLKNQLVVSGYFFCANEVFFCHSFVPMLLVSGIFS
jgi:hypothetical protein